MDTNEFISNLEKLHQELQSIEEMDEDKKQLLINIQKDIERITDKDTETLPEHHKSLLEKLTDSAEEFEIIHPTATSMMKNIISTLNNIGI